MQQLCCVEKESILVTQAWPGQMSPETWPCSSLGLLWLICFCLLMLCFNASALPKLANAIMWVYHLASLHHQILIKHNEGRACHFILETHITCVGKFFNDRFQSLWFHYNNNGCNLSFSSHRFNSLFKIKIKNHTFHIWLSVSYVVMWEKKVMVHFNFMAYEVKKTHGTDIVWIICDKK